MIEFEAFKQQLQSALAHLHDPDYRFTEAVHSAAGCSLADPACRVQSRLVQRIAGLAQDEGGAGSHMQHVQDVLHARFVLGLTQDEAAAKLNMSLRTLQRSQREAVHVLAARLWQEGPGREAGGRGLPVPPLPSEPERGHDWRSQVRSELLALQEGAPDARADVGEVIRGALRIAGAAPRGETAIETGALAPGLTVRFHPSVLRQILLSLLSGLQESMSRGRIVIDAERAGPRAHVSITGAPIPAGATVALDLVEELLGVQGGAVTSTTAGDARTYTLDLPSAPAPDERVRVLVIEDNPDLAALYRSYCAGSRYDLTHIREGRRALAAIAAGPPDVILLDVMLPDVDGWDLLLDLHANPATSDIPIIVCSVITDEQLARDLGAALYLRKPIWPERLLAGLDSVLKE